MHEGVYQVEARVEREHWWFRGRRRILRQLLAATLGPQRPALGLDIGCGTGGNAEVLAQFVDQALGIDISATPLRQGRARRSHYLDVLRADALSVPLPAGSVDLLLALDLLEHLDDDAAALREWHRLLRPGGRLIVFVPAHAWLWGHQDEVSQHRRRYTAAIVRRRVEQAGFAIERLTPFNLLLLPPIFAGRQILKRLDTRELQSENQINNPLINALLTRVFAAEAPWLARRDLPLGVSLACVARRR